MKLAGIIAEYNPFHKGHEFLIEETRKLGASHIAVVMSGSFVQRGDMALFDKWIRAKMAVFSGADLVVELPVPYSLASAQTFARAGVYLLKQLGIEWLSFGSETGEIEGLQKVAQGLTLSEGSGELGRLLKSGLSYPSARALALQKISYGDHLLLSPNNLLGIEYMNAISEINAEIKPIAIKRQGASHDSQKASGSFVSASFIRKQICESMSGNLSQYLPEAVQKEIKRAQELFLAPVLPSAIEPLLLSRLREKSKEDWKKVPCVNEGLEHRIYEAAGEAVSLQDFCERVKSKRYTMARIRRIAWCGILNIEQSDQEGFPKYLRVLALNHRGREILARQRGKTEIPVGVKFKDLYDLHPKGIALAVRAEELFSLAVPSLPKRGRDFWENPYIEKSR